MGSFLFIYDFAEFYFALTMSASRHQPEFHMGDANRAWKRVPLIEQSCLQAHGVSVDHGYLPGNVRAGPEDESASVHGQALQ